VEQVSGGRERGGGGGGARAHTHTRACSISYLIKNDACAMRYAYERMDMQRSLGTFVRVLWVWVQTQRVY
jgi:hypothetical protein